MQFDFSAPDLSTRVAGLDLTAYSAGALATFKAAALAESAPLRTKAPADLTEDDLSKLRGLRAAVTAAKDEATRRETAASEAEEIFGDLDEADEDPDADEPADAPAEPEAPAEPVVSATPAAPEPLTAAAKPRVSAVAPGAPRNVPAKARPVERFNELVVPANGKGQFGGWMDVARAAKSQMDLYFGAQTPQRHSIALLKKEFSADLRQSTTDDDVDALLDYAADESRLDGGSLTAAAGWCAPSTTSYDLLALETRSGMWDGPEIDITRGGLRFTPGPDFASIFGGAGYFNLTEAQVIADTLKPCMEIPCPDFQDIRLNAVGLCITASLLQRRGYPEMVDRFVRGALVAHAHRVNAWVLAQIVAGSTAVTMGTDVPLDVTATTNLLDAVSMQVMDVRYRHRMSPEQTAEVVLPEWALGPLRADLSRKTGISMYSVTREMVNAWLRERGGRAQYVYDWQDAYSGLAAGPGGPVPLALWPNTVQFLVYPAGTWVKGTEDVIRLDTVYDSTMLSQNLVTQLFTEEGVLMARRGHDSRVVTIPFHPTGITAAQVAFVAA